jgi:hypothetical protein
LKKLIKADAISILDALMKVIKRFGTPQLIISDGALVFTKSELWKNTLSSLKCYSNFSSAYHQQGNGQTERKVKEIKPIISIKCNNNIDQWPNVLLDVQSSINSNISTTTGMSAYKILFGYEPNIPIENKYKGYSESTIERHEKVLEEIIKSKEKQENSYNNNLSTQKKFEDGEKVWIKKFKRDNTVDVKNIPAEIIESRGPDSYVVSSAKGIQNLNAKDIIKANEQYYSPIKYTVKNNNENDTLIGKKVSVWWPSYNQHYSGVITPTDNKRKGSHIVKYDDGQEIYEWLNKVPKNRVPVEYEVVNDFKRYSKPKPIESISKYEFSDESTDDDYVCSDEEDIDEISSESEFILEEECNTK